MLPLHHTRYFTNLIELNNIKGNQNIEKINNIVNIVKIFLNV